MNTSDLFEKTDRNLNIGADFSVDWNSMATHLEMSFRDITRTEDQRNALRKAMWGMSGAKDEVNAKLAEIDKQYELVSAEIETELMELAVAFKAMVGALIMSRISSVDNQVIAMVDQISVDTK